MVGPLTPPRSRSLQFGFFRRAAITKNNSRRIGENDPKRRATDRRSGRDSDRSMRGRAAGADATPLRGHGRGQCCQLRSGLCAVSEVRAGRQRRSSRVVVLFKADDEPLPPAVVTRRCSACHLVRRRGYNDYDLTTTNGTRQLCLKLSARRMSVISQLSYEHGRAKCTSNYVTVSVLLLPMRSCIRLR